MKNNDETHVKKNEHVMNMMKTMSHEVNTR